MFAIVLGLRGSEWSKWAAIPCFVFWAVVMILIWLFLLGWARIVTGTFSPTETAMTIVVGLASIWGVVKAFKIKTNIAWWKGILLIGVLAVLQVGALRLSFMSLIAHR